MKKYTDVERWIADGMPVNAFVNGDCMEALEAMPENYADLAVVDPPYGINRFKNGQTSRLGKYSTDNNWNDNKPNEHYFKNLFRTARNEIVFGGNYFTLPQSRGWFFWYKHQPVDTYPDGELAWTSFDTNTKCCDYPFFGDHNSEKPRINPAQKPIPVYRWILQNYASPGDLILDTHVGSASSLIACMIEGFDYVGFELDKEYYEAACERIKNHQKQHSIFEHVEKPKTHEQLTLLGEK